MNIALIVVIAILALFGFLGKKRGLIMTVYNVCSFLAGIILTHMLSPIVTAIALKSDRIYSAVYSRVQSKLHVENFTPVISKAEEIGNDIAANATRLIITAGAFVFTFIVVMIALRIIAKTLDLVSKLPVLHQVNSFAGLAAGLFEGYIIISLLGILLTWASTTSLGIQIMGMINDSSILTFMYNHNLVLMILAKLAEGKAN